MPCGATANCVDSRCDVFAWSGGRASGSGLAASPWLDDAVIAADALGGVYLAHSAARGGAELTAYEPSGVTRWSSAFSTFSGGVRGITMLGADTVVFATTFEGSWRSGATSYTSAGLSDVAVVALSVSDGSIRWTTVLGGVGSESAGGIAASADGTRIAVAVHSRGTMTVGGVAIGSRSEGDLVLVTLEAVDGRSITGQRFGGDGTETDTRLAVDAAGNFFIAGLAGAGIDFGAGTSGGIATGYLASLAPDFSHRFTTLIPAESIDGIAVNTIGVYVSGTITRSTTFAPGFSVDPGFDDAVFALGVDVRGSVTWVTPLVAGSVPRGGSAIAASETAIYFAATFSGRLETGVVSSGSYDVLLATLSVGGRFVQLRTDGGDDDERATSVARGGRILAVAGRYRSAWDTTSSLPPSARLATRPPVPTGGSHVFVVAERLD